MSIEILEIIDPKNAARLLKFFSRNNLQHYIFYYTFTKGGKKELKNKFILS